MTPAFRLVAILALLFSAGVASAFPLNPYADVNEYVNELTGHYVLLDSFEGSSVENGSAGPGWQRTGYRFTAVRDQGQVPSAKPVCRFYSPVNNSHFLTADAAECEFLRTHASEWNYEKIAFYATGLGPSCPVGQSPIYRLYNNRHAVHDANHRFTPDPAVRDEMLALGWVNEGVAFCTDSWSVGPQKSFEVSAKEVADTATCESRVGPCVALGQVPAMPNIAYSFFPPFYVNRNPAYPLATMAVTGAGFIDVRTSLAPDDPTVAQHTFLHMYGTGGPPYGIHLSSIDRLGGPYASITPMYELPGWAPSPGGIDQRVFPWKGVRDHTLVAKFDLVVPTLRRADPPSHAYGVLVLQFADLASGRSFYATVQAYGSVPPGDFVAPDAFTGRAIVSTVFRGDPLFGTALAGTFMPCTPDSGCRSASSFVFRMGRGDFEKALRGARTIDPALSTNPASYFVAQAALKNEIYGAAELGATVQRFALDLWY